MDKTEREALAYVASIRRALRFGEVVPTCEDAIHRAMGANAVIKGIATQEARVARFQGRPVIWTSARLRPARRRWCVAHAFVSWVLEQDGVTGPEAMRLRSPMAAELLLPESVAGHVLRVAGATIVADEFVLPTAATYLREGELLRLPTALVVPSRYSRVRGDDAGRLPTDLRALEMLAGSRGIGVFKVQVPEDGGTIIRLAALLRSLFLVDSLNGAGHGGSVSLGGVRVLGLNGGLASKCAGRHFNSGQHGPRVVSLLRLRDPLSDRRVGKADRRGCRSRALRRTVVGWRR